MEINGLPLHPLIVHAAVVFGPLSALLAVAYVAVPRYRDRLRWVTVGLVVVALVSIWAAYLTGENFRDSQEFFRTGALGEKIEKHEELATKLRLIMTGFAVVTGLQAALHQRTGTTRVVLGALVVIGAVATLVYTVLTGDAGAQAVYGS